MLPHKLVFKDLDHLAEHSGDVGGLVSHTDCAKDTLHQCPGCLMKVSRSTETLSDCSDENAPYAYCTI